MGYFLNRISLWYLNRYTGQLFDYCGLASRVLKSDKQKPALEIDMVLLETAAAFFTVLAAVKWGWSIPFLFLLPVICLILILSFIDSRIHILPNQLNGIGVVLGLCYTFFRQDFGLTDAFLGMIVGGGFSFLTAQLYLFFRGREGLGFGDVKLLLFFGTFAGGMGILLIILIGSFIGALWGILSSFLTKRHDLMGHEIPFGPFLGMAALGYLFFFM